MNKWAELPRVLYLQKLERWNTPLMILEGTLFWAGLAFQEMNTVVSVFMQMATRSVAMAGLAATLMNLMPLIGQFILGLFIHRLRNPHRFMITLSCISRPLILLMLPMLRLFGMTQVTAVSYLVLFGLFMCMDGMVGLIWIEISVRTLAPRKRGMVSSTQRVFAGLIGLVAGTVIRNILGSSLAPQNQFSVIFALSGFCLLLNTCLQLLMKDDTAYQPCLDVPVPKLGQYIAGFVPMFRASRSFQQVIVTRILFLLGMISAPLYILYASVIQIPAEYQTYLFYMPVLGQILGGFFWAQASMRHGYVHVIRSSQVCNAITAICGVLVWLLPLSSLSATVLIALSMALLTFNTTAYIGYNNHIIDTVPNNQCATYIILQSILLIPFTFGSTIAGSIAQTIGYGAVFIMTLVVSMLGIILSMCFFGKQEQKM